MDTFTECSFCGYRFDEEEGARACGKCAAFGGCRMVKCPRCEYEMPQTPGLIKLLRKWRVLRSDDYRPTKTGSARRGAHGA